MKFVPLELDFDDPDLLEGLSLSSTAKHGRKNVKKRGPIHRETHVARQLSGPEYMNISCRFVVRPGTLDPLNCDVDKPLPRQSILRAYAPPSECPICLSKAVAPRMLTGCGHVLCLVCYFNHLKHAERALCPICADFIPTRASDLLPVTFLDSDPRFAPQAGHEAVLKLVRRPIRSVVAMPISEWSAKNTVKFPSPSQITYSRLAEETSEPIQTRAELNRELAEVIQERETALLLGDVDEGFTEALDSIRSELRRLPERFNGHKKPLAGSETDFYFYQTGFEYGGDVRVLSQLDVSILKSAYGSFDAFPATMVAPIEDISHVELTGELRQRMKYLWHLPDQTPIALLECNWTGIIAPEILSKFGRQIAERRRRRKQRTTKEERDRQRAEKALDAQFRQTLREATPRSHLDTPININAAALPSLTNSTGEHRPEPVAHQWVDHQAQYEELLRNTYVPKRGRKQMILK